MRSADWTSPSWRVEGESSVPEPKCGPLARDEPQPLAAAGVGQARDDEVGAVRRGGEHLADPLVDRRGLLARGCPGGRASPAGRSRGRAASRRRRASPGTA